MQPLLANWAKIVSTQISIYLRSPAPTTVKNLFRSSDFCCCLLSGSWILNCCGNWVIVIINQLPRLSRPQFDIILHQDLIDALQGWIELKLMHSSDNSIIISILFALCSEDSSIATKPTRTRTLIILQEDCTLDTYTYTLDTSN